MKWALFEIYVVFYRTAREDRISGWRSVFSHGSFATTKNIPLRAYIGLGTKHIGLIAKYIRPCFTEVGIFKRRRETTSRPLQDTKRGCAVNNFFHVLFCKAKIGPQAAAQRTPACPIRAFFLNCASKANFPPKA